MMSMVLSALTSLPSRRIGSNTLQPVIFGAGLPAVEVLKRWFQWRQSRVFAHALHEDGADHSSPTNETDARHGLQGRLGQ